MDTTEAIEWLYGRQALGIKLGLDKVHRLMEMLGNPQNGFMSIHVAGTNGKGTVTTLLSQALQNNGYRVGRFTSPHLVRFNERIAVDGQEIPDEDITRLVEQLRPHVEVLDADGQHPTFFELATAVAFLWFKEQGVDLAVVEAGMGGRLDATNVLAPKLTIITNVAMDHQQFLGDHIVDIAAEKAGIMKPGVPCVTGAQGEALIALKATSHAVQCPMGILDEDYQLVADVNGFSMSHPGGTAHYDVQMAGEHQIRNAAIVVAAADALRAKGLPLSIDAVQRALADTTMPGRMETIQANGIEFLLDGAHNLDAAVALRRHFAHVDVAGFQLVVGFSADKDWENMLGQWAPLAARVIGVPLRSGRGLDPASIRALVEGIGIPFLECPDMASAIRQASAAEDLVVVAGSLFLVGEARAVLRGEPLEGIRGNQ